MHSYEHLSQPTPEINRAPQTEAGIMLGMYRERDSILPHPESLSEKGRDLYDAHEVADLVAAQFVIGHPSKSELV